MRARRVFDLAGAAGGLLVFSPVCLVVAIAILLEDGGPVLFHQERPGEPSRAALD